ncbi:MAG: hypothetical protein KC457_12635 [Myxococcales bacterium]|nr:hypothetical protein [Myxococcales bacterium]
MDLVHLQEHDPLWEIEVNSGTFHLGLEHGQLGVLKEMILGFMELRGIASSSEERARIRDCTSVAQLREWAGRAREVVSASQLFAES